MIDRKTGDLEARLVQRAFRGQKLLELANGIFDLNDLVRNQLTALLEPLIELRRQRPLVISDDGPVTGLVDKRASAITLAAVRALLSSGGVRSAIGRLVTLASAT